jgi:hypothetical protein
VYQFELVQLKILLSEDRGSTLSLRLWQLPPLLIKITSQAAERLGQVASLMRFINYPVAIHHTIKAAIYICLGG